MRTAETIWDRIVAYATPAMPMWPTITKSRSRTIFKRLVSTRNIRGRVVSPTARRMPLPML